MYRFGKRVSRAFSFNKTPRKLKRAMSSMTQMMSPFNRRESLSLTNVNTPGRGNLTAMRLASTNDLSVSTTIFFFSAAGLVCFHPSSSILLRWNQWLIFHENLWFHFLTLLSLFALYSFQEDSTNEVFKMYLLYEHCLFLNRRTIHSAQR